MSIFNFLLIKFNYNIKILAAAKNICAVYGKNALNKKTAQRRFLQFKKCNFYFKDIARPAPVGVFSFIKTAFFLSKSASRQSKISRKIVSKLKH